MYADSEEDQIVFDIQDDEKKLISKIMNLYDQYVFISDLIKQGKFKYSVTGFFNVLKYVIFRDVT